jgi:hypothetical protein
MWVAALEPVIDEGEALAEAIPDAFGSEGAEGTEWEAPLEVLDASAAEPEQAGSPPVIVTVTVSTRHK